MNQEKARKRFSLSSILTIRKKPKEIVEKEEKKLSIERVMPVEEPLRIVERDPSWRVLESYYVYKPFVKITIAETPTGPMYFVEEQGLTPEDKSILSKLAEILMDEIHPPSKPEDVRDLRAYVFKEVERIAEKYRDKLGLVGARRIKVFYYVERNLLGYGAIDPFLRDPNIEDLSCNGVNVPIFIWHRRYESIPTNVSFMDEEYLNELIMKLAHMAGKHISIAYPVLDAMLPEKHRVAATYGHEVSVKGPSFTIRKFREKPFSVIELIEQGNIDSLTSAYIWLLLEHGKTFMVAGGTGTGKTTLLNALSMFIKPGMKIVTIEDTPELNLPHVNWVQLTSREVYIAGAQSLGTSVKLYDLVKLSLRYRPDYIIVGEVRGDEAFVLFQAMATGHSGASTIHAETLDYAVKRLTSPPMNIPPTYMRLMNVFMHVQRVITRVEKGVVKVRRRITVVQEVEDFEKYIKISTWDPRTDSHVVNLERSIHLQDIALKRGLDVSDLIEEIKRRSTVLEWMLVKGIKDAWDVSRIIFDYYYEPKAVYEKARSELEELLKKESVETPAE
ncbi:type II/IV secretion system ATPase subunit [Thermosphaera chiliense]|uniref:Type II/IV secretion system ATPase subunit n=1 Tax=Thermosphaera chiliense TaxID=3402707 RepID=A0A7M1UPC2_9CREN|nr:type II/IV secretion system ATPase subunit [Thermosphaera aggregans]QOR94128.1 type II/IV secretion system ATPase subunit [Thermosphaera aggregans]